MKKIIFSLLFLLALGRLSAQTFELPTNLKLNTSEDYISYEPDVLKAIDWLEKNAFSEPQEKVKKVNFFLIQWISGTPTFTLDINSNVINIQNNPQLLIFFMSGWTKYVIQTKDTDKKNCSIKGIESVLNIYQQYRDKWNREPMLDTYLALQKEGKLQEYISNKVH